MNSTFKHFPDDYTRFQRRDDEFGAERETRERREMQDWHLCNGPSAWPDEYPYDVPPEPAFNFEESLFAGRGDMAHLFPKTVDRKR